MWQMSVGRNEGVCGKSISVTEGDVIGNAGMDSGLFYQTPVSSNGGNTAVFVCSDAGKTVTRAIYEKKEIPSGVILGTSIGGLAVCAAVAVGFMVLWMQGIV